MLQPIHLKQLQVSPATHPRGQPHISAASGLVHAGQWLYMVADDEHHLGMLRVDAEPGDSVQLHRIVGGDLPVEKGKRKKVKPDFEALALLPPTAGRPFSSLLAMGSGSKPNREQAFLMTLDGQGEMVGEVRPLDLSKLYQALRDDFADLNIEGAFVSAGSFMLLQRGNKGDARNACIELSLPEVQAWIDGTRSHAPSPNRIMHFDLGEIDGVPLGFTDGAALPDGRWLFSAVAEDTLDSYADGACACSVLGWVSTEGNLTRLERLSGAPKVEGIAMGRADQILMVTDADDPQIASQLLSIDLT